VRADVANRPGRRSPRCPSHGFVPASGGLWRRFSSSTSTHTGRSGPGRQREEISRRPHARRLKLRTGPGLRGRAEIGVRPARRTPRIDNERHHNSRACPDAIPGFENAIARGKGRDGARRLGSQKSQDQCRRQAERLVFTPCRLASPPELVIQRMFSALREAGTTQHPKQAARDPGGERGQRHRWAGSD